MRRNLSHVRSPLLHRPATHYLGEGDRSSGALNQRPLRQLTCSCEWIGVVYLAQSKRATEQPSESRAPPPAGAWPLNVHGERRGRLDIGVDSGEKPPKKEPPLLVSADTSDKREIILPYLRHLIKLRVGLTWTFSAPSCYRRWSRRGFSYIFKFINYSEPFTFQRWSNNFWHVNVALKINSAVIW